MPTSHLVAPAAVASAVACAVIWKRRTQCKRPAPKEPEPQKPESRVRKPSREPRDKHKVVGILQIDYVYTPVLGDVDNANTFGFHTRFARVKGSHSSARSAATTTTPFVPRSSRPSPSSSRRGPLVGISGNCGFMMWYQARVRELPARPSSCRPQCRRRSSRPPSDGADSSRSFCSPPTRRRCSPRARAASRGGRDDGRPEQVRGAGRGAPRRPLADPSLGSIDTEVARASLVDCVRARIFADPSIACLLLECTGAAAV